jgi:hypothetical protein
MNLTAQPPRSPRRLFAGVVGLARTTDKARAFLAGTLGDYHFGKDCPHDRAVFHALAIDCERYLTQVDKLNDTALEAWVRDAHIAKLPAATIEEWNVSFLRIGPGFVMTMLPSDHPLHALTDEAFEPFRARIAPQRPDIRTFVDLLDFEDGRTIDHLTVSETR